MRTCSGIENFKTRFACEKDFLKNHWIFLFSLDFFQYPRAGDSTIFSSTTSNQKFLFLRSHITWIVDGGKSSEDWIFFEIFSVKQEKGLKNIEKSLKCENASPGNFENVAGETEAVFIS